MVSPIPSKGLGELSYDGRQLRPTDRGSLRLTAGVAALEEDIARMSSDRLRQQIEFVLEIDKLKQIERRTLLTDRSRQENSAEHSWHLATMALLLTEYGEPDIDLMRTFKMIVVHDIVEIDAGDTFCYDEQANDDKSEREERAAERLFNLLPNDQAAELRALWNEFEERRTPEARYAAALDRLQPLLQNFATSGASWRQHGVVRSQVLERNRVIGDSAPRLWQHAERLIDEAVENGFLEDG
jgi:putative hydrolase of HD superfamily